MLTFFLIISFLFGCGSALGSPTCDSGEDTDYYSPVNVLKFAEYLFEEGDYLRAAGEYQRYLFFSPQDADMTIYRIGLCYRLAGDRKRAIDFFRKVATGETESGLRFAASYQIAYSYFLSDQYENSIQYLDQALRDTEDADEQGKLRLLTAFNYLHQRRWQDAEHVLVFSFRDDSLNQTASSLRESARTGMALPRRNPLLAGLLSAVVPGVGKIYCKQYGDGLYSLFLTGVTGLLAWDGFRENGIHSARGWIFGSMCGIFYAGNVYGSAVTARVYNHHLETDLLKRLPEVPDD